MLAVVVERRLYALVMLLTSAIKLVHGQGQADRYDILTGPDGQTSCNLRDTILAGCSSPPSPLNATPTPTLCTCNIVFFNIWSACLYSSGNNTLPVYSSWLATCTNSSIDLRESASMESNGYPKWATLAIPGNTSFDIQKAVAIVLPPYRPWSPVQKVLPAISAIVAIILTVIATSLYQRKFPSVHWKQEMTKMVSCTPRVKSVVQQSDDWEIEPIELAPPGSEDIGGPYEPVRALSPMETVPGHPSNYSESSIGGTVPREGFSEEHTYPFSLEVQATLQAPPIAPVRTIPGPISNSSSSTPPSKWSLSRSSRVHIPKLFRRGPIRVVANPPHKGWGIDQSTDASSSKRSTFATTTEGGTHIVRTSIDPIEGPTEVSEADLFNASQDEHMNLITDEERTNSMLFGTEELTPGTRSGHSSSVNSHINVISPSNSTSSPTSARISQGSRVSFPRSPIPIPPLPERPAPAPPQLPQRIPPRGRENNAPKPSQNYFLQERTMSPIQEDLSDVSVDVPQRAPLGNTESSLSSQSSGIFPARSGSGGSSERRPLPSPAGAPGLVPQVHRPTQHQPSQSFSSSSGLVSGPLNDSSSSLHSTHSRSSSADHPRPLPPTNGLPFNRQQITYAHHGHQRSGSNNSASSGHAPPQDHFDNLFPPAAPHQRGLSADDTDSFYWTSEPAISSGRSGTPNSLSDPSAFFPGSVRGAGYGSFH